jgi:hypothetical protein
MKNDKTKLIIWATVALVIGVLIGTFLVAPATTGEAKAAFNSASVRSVNFESMNFCVENGNSFKDCGLIGLSNIDKDIVSANLDNYVSSVLESDSFNEILADSNSSTKYKHNWKKYWLAVFGIR